MLVIHSCEGIVTNRGCVFDTIFIISRGVLIVPVIGVTGEVGVIITVIVLIIIRNRLTIVVVKYNTTGIVAGKAMYKINDCIRHG